MKRFFTNLLCLIVFTLCSQAQNPGVSRDDLYFPVQQINDPNTSGFNEFGGLTKVQGRTMVITSVVSEVSYVYQKTSTNTSWQLSQTLKPSSSCGGNCSEGFGTGVAISPTEGVIVVSSNTGVFIYEKTISGVWNQFETQYEPVAGNCANNFSIAISENLFSGNINSGIRIAVSACSVNNQRGGVAILHKTSTSNGWYEEKAILGDLNNAFLGTALGWSGRTLFISAPGENNNSGAIHNYRISNTNGLAGYIISYDFVNKLESSDLQPNDFFGATLIANDTRLVATGKNKAYVFYKNTINPLNNFWPTSQDQTLTPITSTTDFGKDLAFTSSGFALGSSSNEIYNYEFSGSSILLREIIGPDMLDQPTEIFGGSLAASGNDLFVYSKYQSNSRSFVIQLKKANPISNRSKLINFYRENNGSNWTNNLGWDTNSKIRYWYGVSTEVINGTERITALMLSNNNLKGRIHFQLNELDYLKSIDFSDNSLERSIPDFSSNTNMTNLNLSNNNYQFGDLEEDFADYQNALGANYIYAPQKNLPTKPNILADIGEQVSIPANVSGTQNNYVWYKRNADNSTTVVSFSETLSFIINASSFGTYFLEVTNNLVPNLKLTLPDFSIDQRGPDYRALLAFYNATNGANWTNNTNWLDNTQPISTWQGVTVENGRVVILTLNNNNLSGSIPAEIEGLTNLKELSLYSSALLSGTIPSEIGNLQNLEIINLTNNNLTGSIPIELGSLSNLKRLRLSDTNLIGEIPASLGDLSNLESLRLVRVPLSGNLPSELMNCINLTDILISETNIEGAIPNEIGQLQNLTRLLIYQNSSMSGEIPEELGLISSLQYISIFENNLEGNIPNSLTNLQNLITLELRNNNLSGAIPDFTNLSQLEYLLLGYNKFQFGDLEPNFNYYQNNLTGFEYSPQSSVAPTNYIQGDIGSTVFLNTNISGINNTYQWTKDNISMPGETNAQLELTNLQVSDYATYFCIVSNTIVVDMSLFSNIIKVGNYPSAPTTAIPDPNFEQLLINLGFDSGNVDGEVPTGNIENITVLEIPNSNISNLPISDLTGIEDFTALQEFSLALNSVTNLDFSNNPNLRKVTIYNNPLVAINLLENSLLTDLIVSNTTGLTFSTIDISQNSNLMTLDLSTNNISTLSLINNPLLSLLRIGNNPINSINLTQNTALEILSTHSTAISSLDVSNHPNLMELIAYSGQLETLNLKNANNANLDFINVSNNPNLTCIEVDDPIVAQANANWIKDPSPITIYSLDCASDAILQDEERNALIAFYNATTGANWVDNSNWLSTAPISTWSGITVNDFNRVKEIVLFNNNIISNSPIDLSALGELEILSLVNNDLSNTNLSSFTFPLTLTSLVLPGNSITGNIPTEIGDLLNLDTLILSANNLDGSIPSTISNLNNLEILFLQDNNLSGELPQTIENLNNLQVINLSNNTLSGTLPSNLSNPNLIRLFISFNEFSGVLPDFSSAPLEQLSVDNNYYDFSDLEPLVQTSNLSSLLYSPQRTQDVAETIATGVGTNLTLNVNDTNINKAENSTAMTNQYQWYKDNSALSGANSADYNITNAQVSDSGDYYCEITNSILPDLVIVRAPITVFIDPSLSTTVFETANFKLFPNPTKDWISIKIESGTTAVAQVFDINGKLILTKQLVTDITAISLDRLPSGLYLVKVNSGNMQSTKRFIKQ